MGLLPEERKAHGLVLLRSVLENVALSILDRISRYSFVNRILQHKIVKDLVQKLDIRTPSLEQKVQYLSGGNQQKVVIAKWFARKCHLYIFDEPTRGIDVGTKVEIYRLMNRLLKEGAAILMISSELPEVLAMADRIYVMSKGRLVAEIPHEEATQEKVLSCALASGSV
jgi:ABC-type sugar transport system ATPase subunit